MNFEKGQNIIYKNHKKDELYWFAEIIELLENGSIKIKFDPEIYPDLYKYPQLNEYMIVSNLKNIYDLNDVLFQRILK